MLQVKPDRPLSPLLLALIRTLDGVAKGLSIPYFVIGASTALLGRDARRDLAADTCTQVYSALANERKTDKFIAQAKRSSTIPTGRAALLVSAFLASIRS